MKKKYSKIVIYIQNFDCNDIITCSGNETDDIFNDNWWNEEF